MTSNAALPPFADPRHIWLEIDPAIIKQAWSKSQICSTPWAKWNAFLNLACIDTFLPWLQEEQGWQGKVWPHPQAILSFSELVQGIAVVVGELRLVLFPSDTLDLNRMYVPQEWIDIPEWIADYYLIVNLNSEESWMQVWGFASHQTIKSQGIYEADERQYRVELKALTQEINVLWLTYQYCPEYETISSVREAKLSRRELLPPLPVVQARNLLERLGNSEVVWPRLSIPFSQWGRLLAHGGWRQQLSDRRQGLHSQWSVPGWLESNIPDAIQQLGWILLSSQLNPKGIRSSDPEQRIQIQIPSRHLLIAGRAYELRIVPQDSPEDHVWRIELRSTTPGELVPGGFQLKLLTEDLQPFPNNVAVASTATKALCLEVALEPGEGLVWETSPLPENYSQEILYF